MEMRAPQINLLSVSRPTSSVPSQCAGDGPALIDGVSVSGFCGDTSGAKIAATTTRRTKVSAAIATRLRRNLLAV